LGTQQRIRRRGPEVKVIALHLYSATSGNCSCSSAVCHRLGRTCSLLAVG